MFLLNETYACNMKHIPLQHDAFSDYMTLKLYEE